jgi:hypothetical protein
MARDHSPGSERDSRLMGVFLNFWIISAGVSSLPPVPGVFLDCPTPVVHFGCRTQTVMRSGVTPGQSNIPLEGLRRIDRGSFPPS